MSRKRSSTILVIVGIAIIGAAMLPMAKASSCCPSHGETNKMTFAKADTGHDHAKMSMKRHVEAEPLSLEKLYPGHFPMVLQSIDKAVKAIELGDKKTALAELAKAKRMFAAIDQAIGKLVKPEFVNAKCPIMGSPINPDKVAKNLIREYKGQEIAFCCGGCPASWDKLSNAAKDAKLLKVQPAPQEVWTCSMHPQIKQSKPGSCPLCSMRLIKASTK